MTELRDRVAEALCDAERSNAPLPWSELTDEWREPWREVADAVLPVVWEAITDRLAQADAESGREVWIADATTLAGELSRIEHVLSDRGPSCPDGDLAAWTAAVCDERDAALRREDVVNRSHAAVDRERQEAVDRAERAERERDELREQRDAARYWQHTAERERDDVRRELDTANQRRRLDAEIVRQAPTRAEVVDAIEHWMPPGAINGVTGRQRAIDVLDGLTDADWLTVTDEPPPGTARAEVDPGEGAEFRRDAEPERHAHVGPLRPEAEQAVDAVLREWRDSSPGVLACAVVARLNELLVRDEPDADPAPPADEQPAEPEPPRLTERQMELLRATKKAGIATLESLGPLDRRDVDDLVQLGLLRMGAWGLHVPTPVGHQVLHRADTEGEQ